jgi:hypothetical protein
MGSTREQFTSRAEASASRPGADMKAVLTAKQADLIAQLKELDASIRRVTDEYTALLEKLQTEKRPLEDALHHVTALLRFEDQRGEGRSSDESIVLTSQARGSITDAAASLLEERDRPMHFKDIAAALQRRNVYIRGKNPAATLLSRMCRDDRFRRTEKRGVYALSAWRTRRPLFGRTTVDSRTTGIREPAGLELLSRQSPFGKPDEQDTARLWSRLMSDRIKRSASLFFAGACYGRAG